MKLEERFIFYQSIAVICTRPTSLKHVRFGCRVNCYCWTDGMESRGNAPPDNLGKLTGSTIAVLSRWHPGARLKPGTYWRQSRQNRRQIADKVDCRLCRRFWRLCRHYFRLCCRFVAGLSKIDCRRLVRLRRPCRGRHCCQSWTCSTRSRKWVIFVT